MTVFLAGALMAALPLSSANSVVAVATVGAAGSGYTTETVVTVVGGTVEFVNLDLDIHNFTAFDTFLSKKDAKSRSWCGSYKKNKCPVFWSKTTGPGETQVEGLDTIEPGEYTFFCTVHPAMKGTLQVVL